MGHRDEGDHRTDVGDQTLHLLFLGCGEGEVLHRPAVEANQVVVVPLQPLGQLVSGHPLHREVGLNDACVLEDCQRAVERREGHLSCESVVELGCRTGATLFGEGCYQPAPALGETHPVIEESTLDLCIQTCYCDLHMRIILIIGMMAALIGCGAEEQQNGEGRLEIVATTTILGDLARQVTGDRADVEVLMPPGADPHEFQASSREAAAMARADIVIANGLGLEEGLGDLLASAAEEGTGIFEVAPLVDPKPFAGGEGLDPHVWLDPVRMAEAARLLGARLAALDPTTDWVGRAEEYAQRLEDVDEEIVSLLDEVEPARRKLVTNHDSLGYFAERFGFEVVGVVIPGGSTLAIPSSEDLAQLVAVIEQEGVRVIFAETTDSTALAEAVATEVGADVEVVELHTGSLGEPGADSDTLIGLLRSNAETIAEALG